MADDNFQALISAELDLSRIDLQLANLQNTPIQLKIEVEGNAAKRLAEAVKRGLKNIDVPDISQQLLDAFNIRNPKIVGQVRRQVNQLTAEMGKSFDGNQIFGARLTDKFDRIFGDLVQTIAQNSSAVKSQMTDFYRSFYDDYKNTMVYISDDMERAMGAAYSNISQSGRITRDLTKGIDLNSVWDEMTTKHPDVIDGQLSNAQDQVFAFINAMKQAKVELKSAVNFDNLDFDLQNEILEDAGNAVSGLAGRIKSELEQSINNASENLKTEILLDVTVNTEKITSDIRQAISQVSAPEHPVDISLNINESELRNRIEAAISGISAENIPIEIDENEISNRIHSAIQNLSLEEILVTVDETELRTEIERVVGATNANITLNVDRNQLENDIRTALNGVNLPVDFRIDEDDLRDQLRAAVAGIDLEVDVRVNVTSFQNNLRDSLRNMPNLDTDLLNRMERLNNLGRDGNDIFSAFGNTALQAFGAFSVASVADELMDRLIDSGREAIKVVKELNDIKVDLQLGSGFNKNQVEDLLVGFRELGDELGSLVQDVAVSSDLFLRSGRTMEETTKLVTDSTILSKIGKVDAEESSEILTAVLNGYQLAADEGSKVVDILSEIDTATASSAGGIGTALSKSAAMANAVGLSLEKTVALAATIKDVTQDSDSSIGTGLKSLLSRLNSIRAGKFVDEETGESLNDVEKVLNKVSIAMRDMNGNFLESEQIIDNVAARWNEFDSNTKKAVATAMAGTYQYNKLIAAFDNYDKVLELTELAKNADGTAMEKFTNSYMESLEAKTNALKNSLTDLSTSIVSDELYEEFLDTAKAAADVAKEIDLVETAFSGLAAGGAVYALTRIITLLQNTALQVEVLGGGIGGLMRVLAQHPAAIAATAVLGVATAINLFEAEIEKAVESAKQSGEEFADNTSGLEDYAAKVTELRTALDSGTLSEQEAYQAKSDLYDIQMSLNESYGYQAEGIDLVNGELSEQIGLLNELAIAEANRFLNEEARGIAVATEEMEKEREIQLGFYNINTDEGQILDEIASKYDNITKDINENTGVIKLTYVGDAEQATEELNSFMTDVRAAQDELGENDEYWLEDIYSSASDSLGEMNKVLDEYQALYDQAQNAKMIADTKLFSAPEGGKNQTAAKWLNDYAEAVEEYNKALAIGDTSEIDAAAQAFAEVDTQVQSLLGNSDFSEYGDQFTEVREQLNEAAISAHEFEEALAGTDVKSAITDFANTIKDAGITELDFKLGLANPSDDTALGAAISGITWEAERAGISVEGLISMLTEAGMLSSMAVTETADATVNAVEGTASSLDDMAETAGNIISNIAAVNETLSSQNTGQSITAETLTAKGLEDYRDALEYVNGTIQLNAERVREISEAKAEEQIAINEVAKAQKQAEYLKNAAEIDKLRQKIEDNNYTVGESEDSIRGQIEGLLASNDAIIDQCGQLDVLNANLRESIGTYEAWKQALSAGDSGDMASDVRSAMENINEAHDPESEEYGRYYTPVYEAAVEFLVPDEVSAQGQEAVKAYTDELGTYFTGDMEGAQKYVGEAIDKGLMEWTPDGNGIQIAAGKTMADFANAFNWTDETTQAMFGDLQTYFGQDAFSWADEAVQTVGDLGVAAVDAAESLRNIETPEQMNITLDVSDIESKEDKIATLKQTIEEMNTLKAQPGISTEHIDQANTVIQYCIAQKQQLEEPAVMSVDTSLVQGKIGEAVAILQQFQTAQNELEMKAAIGMDTTEAQANVDVLAQQIQGLDTNVAAVLNIDTTNIDTINDSLAEMTPELLVKAGIDDAAIIGYEAEQKEATVVYGVDHTAVDLYNPKDLTRKVYYNVVTRGSVPEGGSGTINGTANIGGTALVNGNWSAKAHNTVGKTLIGEIAPEIVVHGSGPNAGSWELRGLHGPEFYDLKPTDIVFNHLQSEELLKRGHVFGRGSATIGGTAKVLGELSGNKVFLDGVKDSGSKNDSGNNAAEKITKTVDKTVKKTGKSLKKILDKLGKLFDWVEVKISRLQSKVDLSTAKSENATGYKKKNNYITDAQTTLAAMIKANKDGAKEYKNHANAVAKKIGLSKNLQKRVQDGTINIQELSEDNQKKVQEYQKWYEKMLECKQAVQDLKQEQKQLAQQKLDNIADQYDGMLDQIEHAANTINGHIEEAELKGLSESWKYYDVLITNSKASITKLEQERAALEQTLQESMDEGYIQENSTEWLQMKSEINAVTEAIQDAGNEVLEFQNKIRQIEWDTFNKGQEAISRITDEADFLIELMSDEKLFDDAGNMTEHGSATVGLHAVNYNTYMERANQYAAEMERINAEIANDPNNNTLLDRRQELLDLQQDSIIAAENEKQAMIDLAEEGFGAQLDALQELIDKYMDALKSAKDMNDFQTDIEDQTEEISKIEKKILAYSNDTSEEGRLKKQQAENELKIAREKLEQTQQEKFIDDQEQILGKIFEDAESFMQTRMDNQDQLLEEMIFASNQNAGSISDTITTESEAVGYTLSEMRSIWGIGGSAMTVLSTYSDKFSTTMTSVQTTIDNILTAIRQTAGIADKQAEANIGASPDSGSKTGNVQQQQTPAASVTNNSVITSTETNPNDPIVKIINSGKSGKSYIEKQRKAKNHSELWNYIVDEYGHVPTYEIYRKLGKKLGVTPKNDYKDGKDTNALLKALKAKGYKKGTDSLDKDRWTHTQENGMEIITLPDGSILAPLRENTGIVNHPKTKEILSLANNHDAIMEMMDTTNKLNNSKQMQQLQKTVDDICGISNIYNHSAAPMNVTNNISISLPNVQKPEDFMNWLRNNTKAQHDLQDVVFSEVMGRGKLSTRKK